MPSSKLSKDQKVVLIAFGVVYLLIGLIIAGPVSGLDPATFIMVTFFWCFLIPQFFIFPLSLFLITLAVFKKNSYIMALGLSVIAFFCIQLIRVQVLSHEALQHVSFGWPFHFIIQDQSSRDPEYYPYLAHLGAPQEFPTQILWLQFGASFIVIYLAVIVVLMGIKKISGKH